MERNGPGQQSSGDQRDPALVDLERLRHGGIPVHAEERLRELGHTGPGALAFTSDLSPDEAGLLRQRGYQPLGLVTGSAVYHVGFAYASAYQDTEVAQLSAAYNEATRLAVGRLSQEAHLAGAEGVVGVRYTMTRHEWTERVIEVQLVGTAVRGPHGQPQSPWLSDLSGQEWWALDRAGFGPAGIVWGHCVWFVLTQMSDVWIMQSWNNQELTHFSAALGACRDRAARTMELQAAQMHATGIVGVRLARRLDELHLTPGYGSGSNPVYELEHHSVTLSLIGTAVRERPDAPRRVQGSSLALSLRDGRLVRTTGQDADATFR